MRYTLKKRIYYAVATILVIILGLSTRVFPGAYPDLAARHAGDALWAAMIYCGLRMLLPDRGYLMAALLALSFCLAVECSQLYQAEWIRSLRSTLLGGLILGRGFLWVDLLRYAAGIVLALLVDRVTMSMHKRSR
jgi:hypothetical protein